MNHFIILIVIYFFFQSFQCLVNLDQFQLFSPRPYGILLTEKITYNIRVTKNNNLGFIITFDGFLIAVDLSNKQNPLIISQTKITNFFQFLEFSADESHILMACGDDGIKIINIKNTSHIYVVSSYHNDNFQANSLTLINDNKTLVVGIDGGAAIFNITNISQPVLANQINTGNFENVHLAKSNDDRFIFLCEEKKGLTVLDIVNLSNVTIAARFKVPSVQEVTYAVAHPKKSIVYILDKMLQIFSINYQVLYSEQQKPQQLNILFSLPINGWNFCLDITKNGKFLILATRSQGVQVIDISSKSKQMVPIQFIVQKGHAYSIKLSPCNDFLYYINALGLTIYKNVKPNLNLEKPNLFLYYQSQLIPRIGIWTYGWKIFNSFDQNLIFGVSNVNGLDIINITDQANVQRIFHDNYTSVGNDNGVQSTADPNILYITYGMNGLLIYNISDPTNATVIGRAPAIEQGDCDPVYELRKNPDIVIMGCGLKGLQTVNVKNKTNPFSLKLFPTYGSIESMIFTDDENYVITANRDFGLCVYDISNINSVLLVHYVLSSGAEYLKFSKNKKFIFLANGFYGMSIYNATDLRNLSEISRLNVGGWALDICLSEQEDYIFISTMDGFELVLADITDIVKPKIIQTYTQDIRSHGCTLLKNESIIALNVPDGIRILPLKNQNNAIQTVIYLKNNYNTPLDKETIFYVGQTIELIFTPLINPLNQKIQVLALYQQTNQINYEYKVIYSQFHLSCSVELMLGKELIGENFFLIKTITQVLEQDFLDANNSMEQADATELIKYLQSFKYLDQNQYPTEESQHDQDLFIYLPQVSQSYLDTAKIIFQNKISLNPSFFIVQSSLKYNNTLLIQTISEEIQAYIQVNQVNGVWFNKHFEGILTNYDENFTNITLTGKTYAVNQALQQLKVHIYDLNNQNIITLNIIDGINYPLVISQPLNQFTYIIVNQLVKKNQLIQQQFNSFYSDGKIAIEQQSSFQFSLNTFSDDDPLTYSVLILNDNIFVPLDSGNPLVKFSPAERSFQFYPTKSEWQTQLVLKVFATDGYSKAEDQLTIIISLVPISFILNLIVAIIGPLLGVFGFIKYRFWIYNIMFTRYYTFSKDFLKVSENYCKQNLFLQYEYEQAVNLFNLMLKYFQKHKYSLIDNILLKDNDYIINQDKLTEHCTHILSKYMKELQTRLKKSEQKEEKQKEIKEQIDQYSRLQISISEQGNIVRQLIVCKIFNYLLRKDELLLYIYKKLRLRSLAQHNYNKLDWYRSYITLKAIAQDSYNNIQFPNIIFQIQIILNNVIMAYKEKYKSQNINMEVLQNLYKSLSNMEISECIALNKPIPVLPQLIPEINFRIILENLKSEAMGLNQTFKFFQAEGENLFCHPQNIYSIKAYRKVKFTSKFAHRLYQLFDLDYQQIEMMNNQPLPQWIKCEIVYNNCLYISGLPDQRDIGEILIRISDVNDLIIKQFLLEVTDENLFTLNDEMSPVMNQNKTRVMERNIQNDRSLSFKNVNLQDLRESASKFKSSQEQLHYQIEIKSDKID